MNIQFIKEIDVKFSLGEHLLSDIAKEQERLQVNKDIVQNLGKNAKEGIIDASIKSADNYAEIIAKSLDSVSVNQASVESLDGMTNGITKDGKLSLAARRLAGINNFKLKKQNIYKFNNLEHRVGGRPILTYLCRKIHSLSLYVIVAYKCGVYDVVYDVVGMV